MSEGYTVENAGELPLEHLKSMKKAQAAILGGILDIYKALDVIKRYIIDSEDLTDQEKSALKEKCYKIEDKISSHLIAEAVDDTSYLLGEVQQILV